MLIDVTIAEGGNVIEKEAEKILITKTEKQKYSACGLLKGNVKPVISGATGTISKSLRKYPSNITGKHEFK